MKQKLTTIWKWILKQNLHIDFFGINLGIMNSFVSVLTIRYNQYGHRNLFFLSYDPIAWRFSFLFIDFTSNYPGKVEIWKAARQKEFEEMYMKRFERKPSDPGKARKPY